MGSPTTRFDRATVIDTIEQTGFVRISVSGDSTGRTDAGKERDGRVVDVTRDDYSTTPTFD